MEADEHSYGIYFVARMTPCQVLVLLLTGGLKKCITLFIYGSEGDTFLQCPVGAGEIHGNLRIDEARADIYTQDPSDTNSGAAKTETF